MILKDASFKDLEKYVDNNFREITYMVINFDVNDDKTKVLRYFAPISCYEPVDLKDLSTIFNYFIGVVVYDIDKYTSNQSNIFSIIQKVLKRRLSEENYKRVINYLAELSFNDYEVFKNNSDTEFIPILSDALYSVKIINALEDNFSKFDINFLSDNQKTNIAQKSEDFFPTRGNDDSIKKQKEDINEFFNSNNLEASIYHESSKTIRKVLKKLKLTKALDSFFFKYIDSEQYLKYTKNFFTDKIKDELFKIICKDVSKDISKPNHKNAEFYYIEILREIKFVNLYELEDTYTDSSLRDPRLINKLYEKMSKDALSGFKIYPENTYANERLNQASFIEMDIRDTVNEEIESRKKDSDSNYIYLVDEEEIRYEIEEQYLDIEDYKSEEIIISLDSDEYKPLTKREKERLKQRKKRALQKRAKSTEFNYEKRAKEWSDTLTHKCNIKVSNKASD